MNELYREELRLWMNLYLPSVKLLKKVRVGSKLRRVYSPAQTPFERVLASGRADAGRAAELEKLRARLDPFELARRIDGKPERIYALANRRLSPKANAAATAGEKTRAGKVKAQTFPARLQIAHRTRDSHFPKAPATTGKVTSFMSRLPRPGLHSQMA